MEAHQTFQSKRMGHVSLCCCWRTRGFRLLLLLLLTTTTPVLLRVKGYFNVQSFLQRARSSSVDRGERGRLIICFDCVSYKRGGRAAAHITYLLTAASYYMWSRSAMQSGPPEYNIHPSDETLRSGQLLTPADMTGISSSLFFFFDFLKNIFFFFFFFFPPSLRTLSLHI